MKLNLVSSIVSASLVAIVAASASAIPLPPGGLVLPPALGSGASGPFSILTLGSSPLTASTFTGTLNWAVLSGDTSNPLGGLTFVYAVENNALSPNSIGRLAINGFGNTAALDVGYFNSGSGTVVPSFADRDTSPFGVIGFQFAAFLNGMIGPGQTSEELIVYTDATSWVVGEAAVIDGSIATAAVPALVPTPGAAGLMGVGILAMTRRRR